MENTSKIDGSFEFKFEKLPKIRQKQRLKANERERKRVKLINLAFDRLKKILTKSRVVNSGAKKISKLQILKFSIDYIRCLQTLTECRHNRISPRFYTGNANGFFSFCNHSLSWSREKPEENSKIVLAAIWTPQHPKWLRSAYKKE
ncbi:achaete-scute homolog 1-like [Centruroides sculpturatus]|uniref:achaete-scute homolog 1-like n=1 Tax=Centruroides sculpturatus TaxID=218467 RepID=UPI000C6D6191|nr:achaete-scute homolog 1-like [Centruroides sculpturatus]